MAISKAQTQRMGNYCYISNLEQAFPYVEKWWLESTVFGYALVWAKCHISLSACFECSMIFHSALVLSVVWYFTQRLFWVKYDISLSACFEWSMIFHSALVLSEVSYST